MTKKLLFSVTLADCRVDTFCSGGKGGQHQNATKSGVRITHPPSGAVGECREERYQHVNKRRAFERMAQDPRFVAWARVRAAQISSGKTIDECVDEDMHPKNLKVEVRGPDGRWMLEGDSDAQAPA